MVEEKGNWVEMKGGNDFTFRHAQFEPLEESSGERWLWIDT